MKHQYLSILCGLFLGGLLAGCGWYSNTVTGSVPTPSDGTKLLRVIGTYAIDACVTQAKGEFATSNTSSTRSRTFAAGPTQTNLTSL